MKKVACIGGGASALMCACFVKANIELTILEKNEKIGKKILATGNGRCNLTNLNMNSCSYNHNIEDYINRFNSVKAINFFNSIGLETYTDSEGRVYPLSNSANSVLDVLRNYLKQKSNVKIKTEIEVSKVKKDGQGFIIYFANGAIEKYDNVVISCGNLAKEELFSDFNINFEPFKPSLCALKTAKMKTLAGVRVSNVKVSCGNFKEVGEVLFREDGISGIVIFNLSAYMARKGCYENMVNLDFMPNVNTADLLSLLKERKNKLKNYNIDDFLTGIFHKAINFEILKKANLNVEHKVESLTLSDLNNIVACIKNYSVQTLGAHNNNQVMSGGVCLEELDSSLQCKKVPGLYFIGEVVDVDGMCGGYNLQWAWTSGYIVAQNLN